MHRRRPQIIAAATLAALALGLGADRSDAATRAESRQSASGLVAAYAFDEGSGATAGDASGGGNTGSLSNTAWTSAGRYGGALEFNGRDSWVTVADAPSLDLTNAMTLEAWVRPTALDPIWRTVIIKEQPGQLTYALYANTDTHNPSGHVNGGIDRWARGTGALPLGSWSFLAATYDGTTLRLFVNGAQVGDRAVSDVMAPSSSPLRFGGNAVWPEWFQGTIDNIRIYNRALSEAELQSDMATPVAGIAPPPPADTQAPSTPAGLSAAAGQDSLTLSWQAATDNVGVAGYDVYLDGARQGSASGTSYAYSGLACGRSYTLAIAAFDAAGNRSGRASLVATTAACAPTADTQAPSVPSGLAKAAATQSSVSLAWAPSTDNVSVAGYGVYRGGALMLSSTATTATVSGLACGTTYSFAVDAYDAAGNRSGKASLDASTAACETADTQAPSTPSNLRKTASTKTTISLAWNAATDNVGVVGYGAYRGATRVGTSSVTAYKWIGLTCGKRYTLAVDAYDAAGNRSPKVKLTTKTAACSTTADTQAPSAPSGLTTTGATETSISLSWTASTDDVGVTGYGIYKSSVLAQSSTSTSATVSGLSCGTSYSFAVDAFDAAGNRSAKSGALTASTGACPPAGDTEAPSVPSGLARTGSTETSISVSWTASSDNVGVAGYGAYRDGTLLGSTGGTTYTFSGLACGLSYFVSVDAFDAAGNRSGRASLSASTSACPGGGTADVFLSPSGSDANACTQAAPCRSFDRAYRVASPGQVVQVAAGSYGSQTIGYDASKTSALDVVFQPAPGAAVTIGQLTMGPDRFTRGASHLTIKDMTLTADVQIVGCGAGSDANPCQPESSAGGDDITLQNLRVKGPYAFYCASCSDVSIVGGVWGPDTYQCRPGFGSAHPEVQNAYNKQKRSRGILIDGATFQNFARCDWSDHTECLQVEPADDVTVRNSVFQRCDTIVVNFANDLAFGSKSPAGYEAPNNILLENNFFDAADDWMGGPTWYAVNIRECTNCTVRYNSWLQAPRMPTGQISLNNKFIGNVGPMSSANCGITGVTYAYNVWEGAQCSTTDKNVADAGFVNRAAMDLHLKPTSPAIDAGNPTAYPSRDIDGQTRTNTPDAGADETG